MDQARHPELLLDALPLLGLLLLLADELRHLHRRRGLGGEVVQELPVVRRVFLLGEARTEIEEPDQLPLAHERYDHLDVRLLHGPQGGRVEVELLDLDHPRGAREVGDDGVVGCYLQLWPGLLDRGLDYGLGDILAGLLPVVSSEETLPETLPAFLLCRHLTSSIPILVAYRLPDVTKSVTKPRSPAIFWLNCLTSSSPAP